MRRVSSASATTASRAAVDDPRARDDVARAARRRAPRPRSRRPRASRRRNAKCVSRWPLRTALPRPPGSGVPSRWPGPKASVRPLAPASTNVSTPRLGSESRATGRVSAQGQGRVSPAPAGVLAATRAGCRRCASWAFASIHAARPRATRPSASSTPRPRDAQPRVAAADMRARHERLRARHARSATTSAAAAASASSASERVERRRRRGLRQLAEDPSYVQPCGRFVGTAPVCSAAVAGPRGRHVDGHEARVLRHQVVLERRAPRRRSRTSLGIRALAQRVHERLRSCARAQSTPTPVRRRPPASAIAVVQASFAAPAGHADRRPPDAREPRAHHHRLAEVEVGHARRPGLDGAPAGQLISMPVSTGLSSFAEEARHLLAPPRARRRCR